MTDLSISQIKSFQDYLKKAEFYKNQGQLEDAINCYQEATKINPKSATAYYNLGNIYLSINKWSEAINRYQTAIEINPNFDWAYYNLGEASYQAQRWEDAIVAYQKALDLNPKLPEIYKKLATSFYQRAIVDRKNLLISYQKKIQYDPYEVAHYHQAIELNPQNASLYLGLGNALVHHRKIDEAIAAYKMALQIKPDYEPAKIQLEKLNNQFQSTQVETQPPPESKLEQAKQTIDNLSQIVLHNFLFSNGKLEFTETTKPVVSIILILYNRAELTLSCLHSLLHQSFAEFELIIVDNNSSDRTKELLKKVKGAKIILNQENKHFLLAANQASEIATGEYLLFLNNDAQILGDSLNAAVETINSDPNIGAVGGKIILPDGTLQEAGSIIWQDGSCLGYGRGDNPEAFQYMFKREVDYCSGAFLLTPRKLFEELGGFDPIYQPAYYEETDYCVKIHKAGQKIVYDPRVTILHYEFASSEKSEQAIALQKRNQQNFINQHQDWLQSQYTPDVNHIFLASNRQHNHNSNGHKILFVDDRIPHPYLGSGYTRGHKILNIMTELGHTVTFYPTDLSYYETWQATYQDLPQTIEMAVGYGLQKLGEFLQSRPNYYDIIFVSRPHNMNHLNHILQQDNSLTNSKIIYDAEALYCLRDFAYQELQGIRLSEDTKQKAIADELKLAKKSNLIISVSHLEREKFLEFGYEQVEVLGHSLKVSPTPNNFEQRKDILFVGSVYELNSPNADSILWFSQEIMPLIQQKLGQEIHLLLVGNNEVKELQAAISNLNNPQIKLLGKVDNLFDFYNNSRLFIAPTRFAAGIPHKVHEASAYGLPVVTTSAIANQLQWHHETDLLVADNPQDFADKCLRLYQDRDLWQNIRNNALKQVENQCSPKYFKSKIKEILN